MTAASTVRAARKAAGLSARQAAEIVGVTTVTWQRWEGQTSRQTTIPAACWELFMIKTANQDGKLAAQGKRMKQAHNGPSEQGD